MGEEAVVSAQQLGLLWGHSRRLTCTDDDTQCRGKEVVLVRAGFAGRLLNSTWSSVVIAGDRPPWTQKMVLSMTADKLHRKGMIYRS